MVVTSLTRNQVVRKGTWVRIPPSPFCEKRCTLLFGRIQCFSFLYLRADIFVFCSKKQNTSILKRKYLKLLWHHVIVNKERGLPIGS